MTLMSPSATILILTYGTRGDVQPFVALALGLKGRGHAVMLCTAARFGAWIEGFGLDFAPLSTRCWILSTRRMARRCWKAHRDGSRA